MKISVLGAGNVGSLTAMRLAQENFGDIVLIDVVKGLAQGKSFDIQDAQPLLKTDYNIQGTDDITAIEDSHIIVITAGLARKPGMSREDLLNKNAQILKDICANIKKLSPNAIVVVVTNPLDLMTRLALKLTDFKPGKVLGMGISLDAARFANLISIELNVPAAKVQACVVGSHGEGMLALPHFTKVNGRALDESVDAQIAQTLVEKTINRGTQIVSFLAIGSAYFAPSAAIMEIVKAIVKDEKRILGVSAYLNGEYGIKDVCIGVLCIIGKNGIEKIIELDLNKNEKEIFLKSTAFLKEQFNQLTI